MFGVGERVVCVDDFFAEIESKLNAVINIFDQLPRKVQEYTIREIVDMPLTGKQGVLLEEIVNKPVYFGSGLMEPNFRINRLEKIVKKPNKVEEYADANS